MRKSDGRRLGVTRFWANEAFARAARYLWAMPSTVIRSFHYDAPQRRLEIEFQTGRRYSYHGVPPRVADAMRTATSKGGYFNRCIRDRYAFTRLS